MATVNDVSTKSFSKLGYQFRLLDNLEKRSQRFRASGKIINHSRQIFQNNLLMCFKKLFFEAVDSFSKRRFLKVGICKLRFDLNSRHTESNIIWNAKIINFFFALLSEEVSCTL